MASTHWLVRPAPVPTLVTVQPMVTKAGSSMISDGAVTLETARSAYGASAIEIGASWVLLFSAANSRTPPPASVTTMMRHAPETSTGITTLACAS